MCLVDNGRSTTLRWGVPSPEPEFPTMAQSARLVRWLIAGTAGAVVVAGSVAAVLPTLAAMRPPATHVVTSISALQSALGSAVPGDVIQLADGTYAAGGPITLSRAR